MKWYSVKKYKPSFPGTYLIRLQHSINPNIFECMECAWINDKDKWDCGYEITHFCIPDPIEIEEN